MVNITKKTYQAKVANGIKVITDKIGELLMNERHVQKIKNLPAPRNKYDKENKKKDLN